jgi:hypothetical protein
MDLRFLSIVFSVPKFDYRGLMNVLRKSYFSKSQNIIESNLQDLNQINTNMRFSNLFAILNPKNCSS